MARSMCSKSERSLSVVVPCFNEEARLAAPLREMAKYLAAQGYECELIVVDDGSSDRTGVLAREVAEECPIPVRVLGYAENRGKGYALQVGMLAALGDAVLFSDADLSTPIDEVPKFLAALDDGADVAIGTRKSSGARIDRHQPWLREQMGKVFTRLVRTALADVSDVTCGFKMFRREVAQDLFSRLRIEGWAFDAELLHLAFARGHVVREVPVRWEDHVGTKVRLVSDALDSLRSLVQIRVNRARGLYREPNPERPVGALSWSNGREPRALASSR